MKEIRVILAGDNLTLVEATSGVSAAEFVNRAVGVALDALRPESEDEALEDEPAEDPKKSGKQDAGKNKPDEAPGKPAEG